MLLPDPDGPTKNEQAPGGTSNETPRSACDFFVAAAKRLAHVGNADHATSRPVPTTGARRSQEASLRMASIGVMREARQAGYKPGQGRDHDRRDDARGHQRGGEIQLELEAGEQVIEQRDAAEGQDAGHQRPKASPAANSRR